MVHALFLHRETDCCVNRGKGNVVLVFNSSAVTVGATRPTSDGETGVLHFSPEPTWYGCCKAVDHESTAGHVLIEFRLFLALTTLMADFD